MCTWEETVGGPLFVKEGAIIPMTAASDSISLSKQEFSILDVYPFGKSSTKIYEDDGVSFDYEQRQFATTEIECEDDCSNVKIHIGRVLGEYVGKPHRKAYLLKIHMENIPEKVELFKSMLTSAKELDTLLYQFEAGWYFDSCGEVLYVKPLASWKVVKKLLDPYSFYNADITWNSDFSMISEIELRFTKGHSNQIFGIEAYRIQLSSSYPVLLADGESKAVIEAAILDREGLPLNVTGYKLHLKVTGSGMFGNNEDSLEVRTKNGVAEISMLSTENIGVAKVTVESSELIVESVTVEVVQGIFDIVLNPTERIRINFEDNWLSYYLLTYAQIKYNGSIIKSDKSRVRLNITGNEDREIEREHETTAIGGTARFPRIILGEPTEPPDMVLHYSAKGVIPISIPFKLEANVGNKMRNKDVTD